MSRECVEPRREVLCYECAQVGHLARNCPHKGVNVISGLPTRKGANQSSNIDKYVKKIKIKEHEVEAFVDPGSSVCTIRESAVDKLNLDVKLRSNELHGFGNGGNIVKSSGIVVEQLKVDRLEYRKCEFIIVPDEVQEYDMILGRSFTEQPNVTYIKVGNTLQFREKNEFPFHAFPELESEPAFVRVVEDVEIEPNSVHFIKLVAQDHGITVPITNHTNNSVKISKNTKVRHCIEAINEIKSRSDCRVPDLISIDQLIVGPEIGESPKKGEQLVNL